MAKISVVISVAPALGPTLSGAILAVLGWRWIFVLMLPLAVAALGLGAARLPDLGTTRKVPIDAASVVIAPIAFGALVWGLSLFGEASHGAAPVSPWVPVALGAVALAVFIRRQLSLRERAGPLLDVSTLVEPAFRAAVVLLGAAMMALFAVVILLPLFAQQVLGLSPLSTGLLVLPGGVAMAVLAPGVGRGYDRWGPRGLVVAGTAAIAGAGAGMALLTPASPAAVLLILHVVFSIGLALAMTPLFTAALSALPVERYSHGSAVLGTVQQVAGAAGIALVITVMTVVAAGASASGADPVEATSSGIRTAFAVCAALGAAAVPLAVTLRRPPTLAADREAAAHH
jgi:DHA2 family lincomycin resistance protein-like MFS transporter